MGNEIALEHPKASNGLTLPLSKSLDSQGLKLHRAMVAVELEVLAKKFDRFGWDRDRGSMAHDRMVTDWMDALHDYPLDEIQNACRVAVLNRPNYMPNEGHIVSAIMEARRKSVILTQEPETYVPVENKISPEAHAALMREFNTDGKSKVKSFNSKPSEVE